MTELGAFSRAKISAKFFAKVARLQSTVTIFHGIITVSQYH